MTVKVTSDSTCDLAPWILRDFDVTLIPLYIIMGGRVHRDGVDVTPTEIFRHAEQTGEIPSTAAVSIYDYDVHFEKLSEKYDAVIHITIGSGFSMCWQNAAEAAKRYKNVFVFDSKNLSSGQGLLVLEAARMARGGALPEEILERLYALREKVETSFLLDRLDYIFKGGRCSLATAVGANIMHLRTCVEVSGGRMAVTKKYRGSYESAVSAYVRDRLGGRRDINQSTVFITHTQATPAAVQAARNAVFQEADFVSVIETRAGCTISCHCGPKTLGIVFMSE